MSQCYSIIIDQGISAPGHSKEVVDGINAIDKRYMDKLMSNGQVLGSNILYSQILMHSCTQKNDVSLAKTFQKYLSMEHCKHRIIDQGKYRKRAIIRKWTDKEYHV